MVVVAAAALLLLLSLALLAVAVVAVFMAVVGGFPVPLERGSVAEISGGVDTGGGVNVDADDGGSGSGGGGASKLDTSTSLPEMSISFTYQCEEHTRYDGIFFGGGRGLRVLEGAFASICLVTTDTARAGRRWAGIRGYLTPHQRNWLTYTLHYTITLLAP